MMMIKQGCHLRQSINPFRGGSPVLVPLALLARKYKRERAGGRANHDARLKLIAKSRWFARAHALETFAQWMEEQQHQGGVAADLANQLLQHDPGLLRLLKRRKAMLPRMLADETESLLVQVRCTYIYMPIITEHMHIFIFSTLKMKCQSSSNQS
jgi:hypothetical protein